MVSLTPIPSYYKPRKRKPEGWRFKVLADAIRVSAYSQDFTDTEALVEWCCELFKGEPGFYPGNFCLRAYTGNGEGGK